LALTKLFQLPIKINRKSFDEEHCKRKRIDKVLYNRYTTKKDKQIYEKRNLIWKFSENLGSPNKFHNLHVAFEEKFSALENFSDLP